MKKKSIDRFLVVELSNKMLVYAIILVFSGTYTGVNGVTMRVASK